MTGSQQATPRQLHLFLGIGSTLLAAVFIGMTAVGRAPLIPGDDSIAAIGYGLCGIAVVMAAVALVVLKPKVPERRPGISVDQYWADTNVLAAIVRVWFSLEGAATLSAVAFLLAGGPVALITMCLTLAAFWLTGPNLFARHS